MRLTPDDERKAPLPVTVNRKSSTNPPTFEKMTQQGQNFGQVRVSGRVG